MTAALFGPVGSVLLGGFGSIAIALAWWRLFPALARRDGLVPLSSADQPTGRAIAEKTRVSALPDRRRR